MALGPTIGNIVDQPPLSVRARALLDRSPVPEYIDAHFERSDDAWHRETNPDGYVGLCIAENKLMFDVLGPKMAQCRELDSESMGYDSMIGSSDFREALAAFLSRTFIGGEVDAEHLAVLNGVGSVLELLFYVLCDPDDGVLVPTPSYTGFWPDLETRDQVRIVPVNTTSDTGFRFSVGQLDEAMANAGRPVKAMLFTNPNNPLGQIHDDDEVRAIISWARNRGVHLVLDEIYALSTFGDRLFRSGASLVEELGDLLHVVWGFSKDFSMSGFRSGVLYSENAELLQAIDGLAYWASTSRDTQSMLRQLLADEVWIDGFLAENRRRLRASYEAVTKTLDDNGVVHLPAEAGLFFLIDVRPMMRDLSWESEDEVWRTLLDDHRVNLTPGIECHNAEPGFMRLVFSGVSSDAAVEGARRIGRFALERSQRVAQ